MWQEENASSDIAGISKPVKLSNGQEQKKTRNSLDATSSLFYFKWVENPDMANRRSCIRLCCHSVYEAYCCFARYYFPFAGTIRTNRKYVSSYQANDIWRTVSATREVVSADMDCHGEIDLVGVFAGSALADNHSHCDPLTKIVHDKSGQYFLMYILNFLRVKMRHAYFGFATFCHFRCWRAIILQLNVINHVTPTCKTIFWKVETSRIVTTIHFATFCHRTLRDTDSMKLFGQVHFCV